MKKEYLIGGLVGSLITLIVIAIVGFLALRSVLGNYGIQVQDVMPAKKSAPAQSEQANETPSATQKQTVTVNGRELSGIEMIALKAALNGEEPPPGDYWYDAETGEFGLVGEAALGTGPKGLNL